ncbi:MAG: hypothetical protein NC228_10800, partial [[Eubacterium] siraeum]|nr:hypothetical protein [[Eubacterium] siraeum]
FLSTIALGLLGKYTDIAPIKGVIEGMLPALCSTFFPICSMVSMAQIYNANLADQPGGYKYFHSIENSSGHFRKAIIFGNMISPILTVPTAAVLMLLYPAEQIFILVCFTFFAMGIMNFFGHVRSIIARIVPLALLGGGIGAFWAAQENIADISFNFAMTIFCGITLAVYIGGFIYSAARASSAWNRDFKASEREAKRQSAEAPAIAPKKPIRQKKYGAASFLANSLLKFPKWVSALLILIALAMTVLPFIAHEPIGEDDYMSPKIFIFFPSIVSAIPILTALSSDLSGNKFARSMPISRVLYTRSLPAAVSAVTAGLSTLVMLAYFVFLAAIDAELSQFSDTLIIGSAACAGMLLAAPTLMKIPAGGLLMIYAAGLPIGALMLLTDSEKKITGFGVPLYLSVIIYVLAVAGGTAWAFYISSRDYRRNDVLLYPSQTAGKGR